MMSKLQRWKRKHWNEYEELKEPMKALLDGRIKFYKNTPEDIVDLSSYDVRDIKVKSGISKALPKYKE